MKYCVDEAACIGCGLCAKLNPEVFKIKDDGIAEAYSEGEGEEAKDSCPTGAIKEDC